LVRVLQDKLPHVRLAYLTSRIYAGYADTNLNPEPYAYESGFAVKWLIEAQVAGEDSLNYDPGQGPVEAPWLSWGPYLWADGTTPRSDGLTWTCSMFATDGTHPGTAARNLVADSLLAFFERDATAKPWFAVSTALAAPAPPALDFAVGPNPARDGVGVAFSAATGESWRLGVVDLAGRSVHEARGTGTGGVTQHRWDLRDERGHRVASGRYWVTLARGESRVTQRLTVLRP